MEISNGDIQGIITVSGVGINVRFIRGYLSTESESGSNGLGTLLVHEEATAFTAPSRLLPRGKAGLQSGQVHGTSSRSTAAIWPERSRFITGERLPDR